MLEKKITYTDYNGVERTESFFFNLSKAELMEMQLSQNGGLDAMLYRIIEAKDQPALIKTFKELILKSFGVKSDDGKRFIKSQELRDAFEQTEAYATLFMELATDDKAASDFVNNVIPKDLAKELEKQKPTLPTSTTA